jgi:uracil-DNA glycosylase family 4
MTSARGFFTPADLTVRPPLSAAPQCGKCGLQKTCRSPKMPVAGRGKRKILVVGEAPGKEEDLRGRPFVSEGRSGNLLRTTLGRLGVDLDRDCWTTNALICRPPSNRIPNEHCVDYCRPNVVKVVRELTPEVVILLGGVAVKSVIGWLWKEDPGGMAKWAGWKVPCQKLNAWVCPTYHPSYVLREEGDGVSRRQGEVRSLLFERHLKEALSLKGRPFEEVPDRTRKLRRVLDPHEASQVITRLSGGDRPVAFDYETDRLKPDHPEARILCCAVSDGELSWAFPWHGEAVTAMGEFLRSRCPKIGYNLKFEERWTRAVRKREVSKKERTRRLFGHGVRKWVHDGMLAAHVLDNRKEVTGLKFQAFALLGEDSYDDALKPHMKSVGSNQSNKLARNVSLEKLLDYCARDALLEWEVGKVQMERLGTWRW